MARYFVNPNVSRSEAVNGFGRYWRKCEVYGGWGQPGETYESVKAADKDTDTSFRFQVNNHLLATLLGDPVPRPRATRLVNEIEYQAKHREDPLSSAETTKIQLQPREAIWPFGPQELPIGPALARFLDDPLGTGRPIGLGLPFLNPEVTVSESWIRSGDNPYHGGFDFSVDAFPEFERPRFDVCASFDGVVWMLLNNTFSGHKGGVVLRHEPAPGVVFATLYQHLQPNSVKLAVGDVIRRGEKIGRVRKWGEHSERTHNHFNLLVRGPSGVPGLDPSSRLWFAIDPFGVYDEHKYDLIGNYNYIPRGRGGAAQPIQGAERTIHWRGNPLIEAFSAELVTPYKHIRRLQMRAYGSGGSDDAPQETAQMLVWLEGDDRRYFVRLGAQLDRLIEEQACALLRDAYAHHRLVRLGYRFRDSRPEISAVWAQ